MLIRPRGLVSLPSAVELTRSAYKPDMPYDMMIRLCIAASPTKRLTLAQVSLRCTGTGG